MDNTEVARMVSTVGWLEEQQQSAQSFLTKLQQQVDQLAAMAKEHGLVLRGTGDDVEHLKAQLARVPGLEESVRRLHEQTTRLYDDEVAQAAQLERLERGQQGDSKRLNQSFVELRQLIDPLPGAIDSVASKLPPLAEGLRRQQDALVELQKNGDLLGTEHRSFSARLQGLTDQLKRAEQEIAGISGNLEPLHQQDDALLARTQILSERVKQLSDQNAAFQELDLLYRDLLERSQLQRAEHQALEGRLNTLGQTVADQGELLQDAMRLIKGIDERLRSEAAAAAERQREMMERWEKLLAALGDHQQLVQVQREREIAELQHQLREFKELAVWREAT
ncbi:MAG: hypothetical protein EPO21_05100 [Chloroflexota bacterium]|nr:MAG: hypothetical protein EPO21_05100 [Chloroflexota bacterium]